MYFDEMSLEEVLNPQGHQCACGRIHKTGLKILRIGQGVIRDIPDVIRQLGKTKPFVVADANTWKAAGEKAVAILEENGIPYTKFVFSEDMGRIEPNELPVGTLTMEYDPTCDIVMAVGSGVVNDCCRVLSRCAHIGHMVVGTAPSMDGYASNSSAMVKRNIKVSLYHCCPQAIIADTDIMRQAPMRMLWAGLGDVLAKYNAICEWRISNLITGEYYCENIARLVRASVRQVAENADGLVRRDPKAVEAVIKGLILSGVAMDFAGISRPASGLEHYFSHMWEMEGLRLGEPNDLHGISVAVGLCMTLPIYDTLRKNPPSREHAEKMYAAYTREKWEAEMKEIFGTTAWDIIENENAWKRNEPENFLKRMYGALDHWDEILKIMDDELPDTQQLIGMMKRIGMPTTPAELGYSEAKTRRAFLGSNFIRNKYLLSSLLWDLGLLHDGRYCVWQNKE